MTYCADHRDVHPIARRHAIRSSLWWFEPIVAGGYLSSVAQADPVGAARHWGCRFALSTCLVFPPDRMVPGAVPPGEEAYSAPIRQSDVLYASEK